MNTTRKKLLELCGAACAAALFAASIAHVMAGALGAQVGAWKLYLAAFCAALAAGACCHSRWVGLAGIAVAGGGLALLGWQEGQAALAALSAAAPALSDYAPFALLAGATLLALLAFGLIRSPGGVYPALAVAMAFFFAAREMDADFAPWRALPALIALAAMFAAGASGPSGLTRALVSVALVAALLATALLPGEIPVAPALQNAAQTVRTLFEDYFRFTHSRLPYSLYMDGYQPLGEALGGPAQPRDEPVMTVTCPDDLYLRGSIRGTYTGWSWTDDAVRSRYLYIDPIRRGARDEVFDLALSRTGAFRETTAQVEFLAEGTSTLFVPHRTSAIQAPATLAVYFNTAGEVFLPREVQPGDGYAFTAFLPADGAALERLSGLSQGGGAPGLTALPMGVDGRVYTLAADITRGAANDYQKAAALRDYLRENYRYTLNGAYVGRDRDFVSAFLFDLREGYCTYFASAMAVLARAAGLSSRYVEGYYVPADASGTATVTGLNAHAWAEIWLEGLGWVPFDATPGDGQNGSGQSGQQPSQSTPEPTPEPTPTPEPPTPEQQESTPTPEPPTNDGEAPTPTPEAGENPVLPPEDDNPPPDGGETPPEDNDPPNLTWLWWLLAVLAILALLAAALLWRLAQSNPARAAAAVRDRDARLLIWYRALLNLFAAEGQFPDSGESPALFARRMREAGLATETFEQFAQAVMASRYAAKPVTAAQLELAAQAYAQLVAQLHPKERTRWLRRRLVSGLGDVTHIP